MYTHTQVGTTGPTLYRDVVAAQDGFLGASCCVRIPSLRAWMERRAHLQIKKLDVRNDKRSVVSDMRIDMARFAELDTARNQYLTYPMFLKMMPKKMRKMFEDDQLLSWAASADLDGDGIA